MNHNCFDLTCSRKAVATDARGYQACFVHWLERELDGLTHLA